MIEIKKQYQDINLKFTRHPLTNEVKLLNDVESIMRSLNHILFVNPGEKLYDNKFGIGIEQKLFENFTFFDLDVLQEEIKVQIGNYDKRINVKSVTADLDDIYLSIEIVADIKHSGETITFSKTLKRIR